MLNRRKNCKNFLYGKYFDNLHFLQKEKKEEICNYRISTHIYKSSHLKENCALQIPITAIRQTAAAAQVFSPENTQTIDNIVKVMYIQNYSHL